MCPKKARRTPKSPPSSYASGPVWLTSFRGLDPARALYERHGFRLVEEREAGSWGTSVLEQRFERRP